LFDGTDDRIVCAVGGVTVGYGTWVAIVRRSGNTTQDAITSLNDAGQQRLWWRATATTGLLQYTAASSTNATTATCLTAAGWMLLAAGKATGTTTPRFHTYTYGTDAWIHENAGGTSADASVGSVTDVQIGARFNTDFWQGDILIAGFYPAQLTDAEVENMAFSLDGWFAPATAPGAIWLLNQSLTTQNVVDSTGNGANQTALTGTAIATNHPPIWNRGSRGVSVRRNTGAVVARHRRMLLGVGH
jgi:hypothetical protein